MTEPREPSLAEARRWLAARGWSLEIREHGHREQVEVYSALVRIASPEGRSIDALAAVSTVSLSGQPFAEAIGSAVAIATRRAVMSAIDQDARQTSQDEPCGAGGPASPETPAPLPRTAPRPNGTPENGAHHAKHHPNGTGHGSGAYAPPAVVAEFEAWVAAHVEECNAKWLDFATDRAGNIKADADLLTTYQIHGHVLKWARTLGIVNAPEDVRAGQRSKFAAVPWWRDPPAVETEIVEYSRREWRKAAAKLVAKSAKQAPAPAAVPSAGEDGPDPDVWPEGRE